MINVIPNEILNILRAASRFDLAVEIALKTALRRIEVLSLGLDALIGADVRSKNMSGLRSRLAVDGSTCI